MYPTIANADNVRTTGTLSPGGDGLAGPTDNQLNSALQPARRELIGKIGSATYEEIRAYSDSSSDEEKAKRIAFETAESYLALSHLPKILSLARLEKSGVKRNINIGEASTTFEDDLSDENTQFFADQGWAAIDEYLDDTISDESSGDDTAFTSEHLSIYSL